MQLRKLQLFSVGASPLGFEPGLFSGGACPLGFKPRFIYISQLETAQWVENPEVNPPRSYFSAKNEIVGTSVSAIASKFHKIHP